ncbi:MAG: hypothetical protein LLG06_13805 [Desulfobacteraceae bacterium]|nr:hypothetical protein [Desulfobacteraceae bacterium]
MYPIETNPRIWGYGPGASNALADTAAWVCLKNAKGCWIYITEIGNNATDLVLTVHQGTTGSGTTALSATFPIYTNLLTTTADTWTRQTDAATYTIVHTAVAKQVNFYIDAAILTAGYDWIQLGSADGHATNIVYVEYQLVGIRYAQAAPPTAVA